MIFASLASGSSGNCTFIHTGELDLLIDCGISAKRIAESLSSLGFTLDDIDCIFLTHEHSDHIKGLKRLMASYHIPVYASEGTISYLIEEGEDEYFRFGGSSLLNSVSPDQELELSDMLICPFRVYHDARGPLGFRVEATGSGEAGARKRVSVCVATDTGYYDDYIRDHLLYLDAALIEANHDRSMLVGGHYPLCLKRRIMSRLGHLCNDQSGKLISEIVSPRLKHVFLAHLSKENNTPALALSTVKEELRQSLGERVAKELSVSVAPQEGLSQVIKL